MQVEFSAEVSYTPTWNGNDKLPEDERITCKLVVLDMNALIALVDAFSEAGITGEVDTDKVEGSVIKPVLKQFGELLPAHVQDFDGLYAKKGEKITIEQVVNFPKFLNLALELLMKLAEVSSPSDDDTKNLNEQSASE